MHLCIEITVQKKVPNKIPFQFCNLRWTLRTLDFQTVFYRKIYLHIYFEFDAELFSEKLLVCLKRLNSFQSPREIWSIFTSFSLVWARTKRPTIVGIFLQIIKMSKFRRKVSMVQIFWNFLQDISHLACKYPRIFSFASNKAKSTTCFAD